MTAQWALLIILATVAALFIVWGALKAVNGIVYELRLLQEYFSHADELEEENA